jgi:transcriptional regulator with XRE-family HTH domain
MNQTRYKLTHLRAWRERKHFSQAALAKASGVGKSTIIRLEIGHTEANGVTVEKLMVGLGISRDQLLNKQPEGEQ